MRCHSFNIFAKINPCQIFRSIENLMYQSHGHNTVIADIAKILYVFLFNLPALQSEEAHDYLHVVFDPVVDLKAWRKSNGITQAKLAQKLKVSKAMVCMVEKGEKPMPQGWEKTLSETTLG